MLGESLPAACIDANGLPGDRGYAVRDTADGTIASAKHPKKWGRLLEFRASYVVQPERELPLPPVEIRFPDGSRQRSDEPGIHRRLSHALGRDVELIRDSIDSEKELELVWAREGLSPQDRVEATAVGTVDGETLGRGKFGVMGPPDRYFDYSVLHIITATTLEHLAALEPLASFDVRRFRPNVVLATDGDGFVENEWVGRTLAAGPLRIRVLLQAIRCVMITLAQEGLLRDRLTLRAVATHNRLDIEGQGRWACAGVFADVYQPGHLAVGQTICLAETPPGLPRILQP